MLYRSALQTWHMAMSFAKKTEVTVVSRHTQHATALLPLPLQFKLETVAHCKQTSDGPAHV